MRCAVSLSREGGAVLARCREYPECAGRGATPAAAVESLRANVLFWLESCPCDQTADSGLVMDVVEDRSGVS